MNHDNAARRANSPNAIRTGIHLVHSRTWQHENRIQFAVQPPAMHPAAQPDQRRAVDTLILGAAALAAPLLWLGHALLKLTHFL